MFQVQKLINIILSKTQRKTPTMVHRKFSLIKIRQFYIRKIKFVQEKFEIYISKMLENFPPLSQLHPFFSDFFNILFSKNCYRIALNRLYKSKSNVSIISVKYVQLIKHGKNFYACKQLKKIAIGKIVKVIKKLKLCFSFLGKINLYLMKIPSIDPSRKTILISGSSCVGKSSLMNKLTKAGVNVGVENISTKSLTLGYYQENFVRMQVIDSPGIDRESFENFSSSEIQTINAIAHLKCIIVYIFDPNECSKLDLVKQIKIFLNTKKCFKKNKQIFILGKTDLGWEKNLRKSTKGTLSKLLENTKKFYGISKTSFHDEIGISGIQEKIGIEGGTQTSMRKKYFQTHNLEKKNMLEIKKPKKSNFQCKKIFNSFGLFPEQQKNRFLSKKNPFFFPFNLKKVFFDISSINKKDKLKNDHFEKEKKIREFKYEKNYIKKNLEKNITLYQKKKIFQFKKGKKLILAKGFIKIIFK